MNGEGPGDPFRTIEAAARDFGLTFNGTSILNNQEYGSTLYTYRENGKTYYSYSEPAIGDYNSVTPSLAPIGKRAVADVHSHGKYLPKYGKGNNIFSSGDKWNNYRKKYNGYLVTPNGSFQLYNYYTAEETTISEDMPSDPNDPDRKNDIDPIDYQKEERERQTREKNAELDCIGGHHKESESNTMSWTQAIQTISSWMQQNPNIKITIQ